MRGTSIQLLNVFNFTNCVYHSLSLVGLVAEDEKVNVAHPQINSNGTSTSNLPGVFVDESDGASAVSNLSTTSSRRRILKMKMRNPLRKKKSSLGSVVEEVVCEI